MRSPTGSTCTGSPEAISPKQYGMRFSSSTWRPGHANGAALISLANSTPWSAKPCASVSYLSWQSGRAVGSQAPSIFAARIHCSDVIGARSSITHSCTELCYYQAIDYAIAHKIPRVEAGAQGEHKIARGYLPATTYSAHYIADRGLRRAIADYLVRERAYVAAAGNELATLTPFRKNLPLESD